MATVGAGLLVVAVVVSTSGEADDAPDGPDRSAAGVEAPGPTFALGDETYAYPTAAPGADGPLGTPASQRRGGTFAFLRTQPGGDAPVAWDPCRPIRVVVADAGAPAGVDTIVADALAEVEALTGIPIEVEDRTDEPPTEDRAPVQTERYGDRWAPLLVAWTDPEAVPALAGDTGGLGGATAVAPPGGGPTAYVTGQLLLDGPQLAASQAVDGGEQLRSVVLHEMGHVMGLAHVDDAGQLMYPEGGSSVVDYGSGDRAGLIELGRGPCVPDL